MSWKPHDWSWHMVNGRLQPQRATGNFGARFHLQYPKRRYAPRTVLTAQKRVIQMAIDTIGRMNMQQLNTLRACGDGGTITLNELTSHLVAAWHLKVRRGR